MIFGARWLGNAVNVGCAEWIGRRIVSYEEAMGRG
jgi:site-specific DNA-cytosine methylase